MVRGEGRLLLPEELQDDDDDDDDDDDGGDEEGTDQAVKRFSYLAVGEKCDGVMSKEASSLEEGAGTICGSSLHKRRGECCKDFTKALNTYPALAAH